MAYKDEPGAVGVVYVPAPANPSMPPDLGQATVVWNPNPTYQGQYMGTPASAYAPGQAPGQPFVPDPPTQAGTAGPPPKTKADPAKTESGRYYTHPHDVPLRLGETLGFTKGRGYYARKVDKEGSTAGAIRKAHPRNLPLPKQGGELPDLRRKFVPGSHTDVHIGQTKSYRVQHATRADVQALISLAHQASGSHIRHFIKGEITNPVFKELRAEAIARAEEIAAKHALRMVLGADSSIAEAITEIAVRVQSLIDFVQRKDVKSLANFLGVEGPVNAVVLAAALFELANLAALIEAAGKFESGKAGAVNKRALGSAQTQLFITVVETAKAKGIAGPPSLIQTTPSMGHATIIAGSGLGISQDKPASAAPRSSITTLGPTPVALAEQLDRIRGYIYWRHASPPAKHPGRPQSLVA